MIKLPKGQYILGLSILVRKKGGRVGEMALKLDMSKTYDRVE